MPDPSDKVCVFCGESCAGQPRVKDNQGKYAHRACADRNATSSPRNSPASRQQASRAPAEPDAEPFDDGDDLMSGLLDDVSPAAAGPTARCSGCGGAMAAGAVVCMSCGQDRRTGRTLTTSNPSPRAAAFGAASAQAGGLLAGSLKWIVAGCVGGGAGAAIWAGISYATGYEIGWIAVIVGAIVGWCVSFAAGESANALSGVASVVIAILAILGGKYAAVHFVVQKYLSTASITAEITDEDRLQYLADREAEARLDAGETLAWPDPDITIEDAFWPEDYPEDLQADVLARHDAMSAAERDAVDQEMARYVQSVVPASAVVQQGFLSSFGLMDILFFALAIGAAYKLGSEPH
jgi:hypothetical protein